MYYCLAWFTDRENMIFFTIGLYAYVHWQSLTNKTVQFQTRLDLLQYSHISIFFTFVLEYRSYHFLHWLYTVVGHMQKIYSQVCIKAYMHIIVCLFRCLKMRCLYWIVIVVRYVYILQEESSYFSDEPFLYLYYGMRCCI